MALRLPQLVLRGLEFFFALLVMALVGNMIATSFAGNPATVNYAMFVAVFAMLSLFYLIAIAFNESFTGHAIIPLALDGLNVLLWFAAAVALATGLGVHSCNNGDYTRTNHITNGSPDRAGRCREAQASTAFLWFGWACFVGSLFITFQSSRGANLRAGGIRKGGPSMSQV